MDAFFDFLLGIILWFKDITGLPQWLCATIVLIVLALIAWSILKSIYQGLFGSKTPTSQSGSSSGGNRGYTPPSNSSSSSNSNSYRSSEKSDEERRKRDYQGYLEVKYEEDKYG